MRPATTPYAERRVFRTPRSVVVVIVLAELLFLAGAFTTYSMSGWTFTSAALAGMSLVGLGGIAEALIQRVVIEDEAVEVRELWCRRRYSKDQIAKVAGEAKGTNAVLLLASGRKVALPGVGRGLGNSLRAWLKR
jgi:hypothetical protein